MEKIHENLNYIGLVAKSSEGVDEIIEFFAKMGIRVLLVKGYFDIGRKAMDIDEVLLKTNVIISYGGDGTLISIARKLALKSAYIIGIHAGNLGFLTDIKYDDFKEFFAEFFAGDYKIERPLMLEISFEKGETCQNYVAFNDIVLNRESTSPMARVDAFLNDKFFNTYLGDGVIVSSAIGSTAYNMSANGPIVYPLSEVFCVTPICPHSLTQRPLILPKKYVLSFENNSDNKILCTIDGQDIVNLERNDRVHIKISHTRANLIRRANIDYFDILRLKLSWGYGGSVK